MDSLPKPNRTKVGPRHNLALTTSELREQLILEHLPQVRLIARRIYERLPESVSLDDLVSTGVLGLIEAIDRFDVCNNAKLKTYAEYRIRGAILDGLRGWDSASRHQRKRSKQIEAAMVFVEHRLQRTATESEIAHELGLGMSEYHEWLVEVRGVNLGRLDAPVGNKNISTVPDHISINEEEWPSRLLERDELKKLVALAITKIPEIEKSVLGLYYHEELTLREISKILRVHESRISKLKSQAILRLRVYMEARWPKPRGI